MNINIWCSRADNMHATHPLSHIVCVHTQSHVWDPASKSQPAATVNCEFTLNPATVATLFCIPLCNCPVTPQLVLLPQTNALLYLVSCACALTIISTVLMYWRAHKEQGCNHLGGMALQAWQDGSIFPYLAASALLCLVNMCSLLVNRL